MRALRNRSRVNFCKKVREIDLECTDDQCQIENDRITNMNELLTSRWVERRWRGQIELARVPSLY